MGAECVDWRGRFLAGVHTNMLAHGFTGADIEGTPISFIVGRRCLCSGRRASLYFEAESGGTFQVYAEGYWT